jgi:hypothetical protein
MCFLKTESKLTLFADDTTISTFGSKPSDLVKRVEKDLTLICEWLRHNRLVINVAKTKAMFLSHLLRKSEENKTLIKSLKINCDNVDIEFITETKVLGVIIDNELKYEAQIKNICKKVNSKTFLLRKCHYLFTESFKPILFKIFIQPHFDYCSTLLLHSSKRNIKRDRLNTCFIKSAKRLLKCKKLNVNLTLEEQLNILAKFNIFPLFYRQFYMYCTFLFNIMKNKNTILCNLFVVNSSRTRSSYIIPKYCTDFKKYSFSVISTHLLNVFINTFLEDNCTINNFKTFLKASVASEYRKSVRFWT